MIKLFNPTDTNILNYRIETPEAVDDEGHTLIEADPTGNYIPMQNDGSVPYSIPLENRLYPSGDDMTKSKRAKLFTIRAGETITLPDYAAEYLLNVYPFLRKT